MKDLMNRRDTIIFLNNAHSGIWNSIMDYAHKLLSPSTYACNLCAISYGHIGMKKEWKEYIESLPYFVEFLHLNEWYTRFGNKKVRAPALYSMHNGKLTLLISTSQLNTIRTVQELIELTDKTLRSKLR